VTGLAGLLMGSVSAPACSVVLSALGLPERAATIKPAMKSTATTAATATAGQ
jgi:hypothetical protein